MIFRKIIEIPLKIEKSCFRKKSIFRKFSKFSDLNFDEFLFSIYSTDLFDFFYRSKWIFEADRTSLPEFASKLTGKSYFT